MPQALTRSPFWNLTLAWVALLISTSCGHDRPAGPDNRESGSGFPNIPDPPGLDSSGVGPDSVPEVPDSVPEVPDTVPGVPDSLTPGDSAVSEQVYPDSTAQRPPTHSGTPFGPVDLFQSWAEPAAEGFGATLTYASPWGIIQLLNTMRANNVRGFLKLTGDPHDTYKTGGKFDFEKWKKETARYDRPAIRAAIAAAVEDGTLLGYSMLDEASRYSWNGSLDKAMIDKMAAFSKSIFPTLPTAVVVPYSWRPNERYRVVDAVITQTWKPTQTPAAYRDEAVAAAKLNGVSVAIALNILAGPQVKNCERRPRSTTCLMTPDQIRKWATTLGKDPNICGVFMWRYDKDVWEKPAHLKAFRDVATELADGRARNCRRPG